MKTTLNVNGQVHELDCAPDRTLADVLRNELGLHGVRVSCSEGECGSCTVLVDGEPVTSCMAIAKQGEEREIVIIEGIGTRDDLHPIQQAFIEEQGFQCAFCTPGFLMSAIALLDEKPPPTRAEIKEELSGKLCRCTGYHTILDGVERAISEMGGPGDE